MNFKLQFFFFELKKIQFNKKYGTRIGSGLRGWEVLYDKCVGNRKRVKRLKRQWVCHEAIRLDEMWENKCTNGTQKNVKERSNGSYKNMWVEMDLICAIQRRVETCWRGLNQAVDGEWL